MTTPKKVLANQLGENPYNSAVDEMIQNIMTRKNLLSFINNLSVFLCSPLQFSDNNPVKILAQVLAVIIPQSINFAINWIIPLNNNFVNLEWNSLEQRSRRGGSNAA